MKFCTMKDVFDHVAKKQRLSSSKSPEVIDQITWEFNEALVKIHSFSCWQRSLLDLGDCFISETSNAELTTTLSVPFFERIKCMKQ
ncbi:hypothetical protein GIB67_008060 [Kingdonia uniflora]|uniref:Uncharacterized protein n=1 Tax=Kingdonia uniflora TaxID=39325 RepID=A0A7J7MNC0_9MAGN|nr:hypothetical protein GIB67_008060 [Kingdonia uniflora]